MRSFFLSRELREKLLLVVFVLLGAAIWGSGVLQRLGGALREFQATRVTLAEQQRWLDDREAIQAAAEAAVANLDSANTFNDVRLSAEVSSIANATGLGGNVSSEGLRTERTPQFSVHTLQVRLSRVRWEQFIAFYDALAQRAPYISIEQFSLSADRSGEQLNASLRVFSVEITR